MSGLHTESKPTASNQINPKWLGDWLRAFQEEQRKQTNYLKNISTVATLFGLLLILSMVLGFCSVLL